MIKSEEIHGKMRYPKMTYKIKNKLKSGVGKVIKNMIQIAESQGWWAGGGEFQKARQIISFKYIEEQEAMTISCVSSQVSIQISLAAFHRNVSGCVIYVKNNITPNVLLIL